LRWSHGIEPASDNSSPQTRDCYTNARTFGNHGYHARQGVLFASENDIVVQRHRSATCAGAVPPQISPTRPGALIVQHYPGTSATLSLQEIETDTVTSILPILLGPRGINIGHLAIQICDDDVWALPEILGHCINIYYLSINGLNHSLPLPASTLPNLRAFKGHPCVAASVVPRRPVSHLELLTAGTPSENRAAHDFTRVPAALRAAMDSSVPLESLSIDMYDAHMEVLHDILQKAFPALSSLYINFCSLGAGLLVHGHEFRTLTTP
jgi:hypothetical protein